MKSNFVLRKATRKNVKLRVGFIGPSGSGKTMSALRFAKGLVGDWDKIAVIDSENGSSELYSHLGEFSALPLTGDFNPDRYIEAIHFLESHPQIECIIIDSISHEWEGAGGILEIHNRMGGKFETWSKVGPIHNRFVQAILTSRCHVLVTGRTKIDYDISKDQNNKTKIEKVGLKTVTKEGLDYELTVSFKISHNHMTEIDKDRTGLFSSEVPFLIDESVGKMVADWNATGENENELDLTMTNLLKVKTDHGNNALMISELTKKYSVTALKELKHFSFDEKKKIVEELKA